MKTLNLEGEGREKDQKRSVESDRSSTRKKMKLSGGEALLRKPCHCFIIKQVSINCK